jgi:hypothetical protein
MMPNPRALDAAVAFSLVFELKWRCASDPERWAKAI